MWPWLIPVQGLPRSSLLLPLHMLLPTTVRSQHTSSGSLLGLLFPLSSLCMFLLCSTWTQYNFTFLINYLMFNYHLFPNWITNGNRAWVASLLLIIESLSSGNRNNGWEEVRRKEREIMGWLEQHMLHVGLESSEDFIFRRQKEQMWIGRCMSCCPSKFFS